MLWRNLLPLSSTMISASNNCGPSSRVFLCLNSVQIWNRNSGTNSQSNNHKHWSSCQARADSTSKISMILDCGKPTTISSHIAINSKWALVAVRTIWTNWSEVKLGLKLLIILVNCLKVWPQGTNIVEYSNTRIQELMICQKIAGWNNPKSSWRKRLFKMHLIKNGSILSKLERWTLGRNILMPSKLPLGSPKFRRRV